jgi:hypothetical protein
MPDAPGLSDIATPELRHMFSQHIFLMVSEKWSSVHSCRSLVGCMVTAGHKQLHSLYTTVTGYKRLLYSETISFKFLSEILKAPVLDLTFRISELAELCLCTTMDCFK